ncbi:hypothetical protein F511_25454 [Dorcoceras hygrometricum]|uniref:Uncharacterized protein n=1 Tax=Dorcoceras hygrometricum TaxID=472368 RepID=A0A2Z7A8T7_9LAMI|nr:hypothetical protein F511_25454 [Dorcoceras hygrometricum]
MLAAGCPDVGLEFPPLDMLTSSSLIPDLALLLPLANITAAGLNWPPPDYEQLTQLWTSSLLIQLPSK